MVISRHSLNLSDLIESEEAKAIFSTLFTQPFRLVDLASIEDAALKEQVQRHVRGVALMMTLKHIQDRHLQAFFDHTLVKVLRQLEQVGEVAEVADILYYLLNEANYLEEAQFQSTIHRELSSATEHEFMTIAQKLEQRGIEKGIKQGRQEGFREGKQEGKQEGIHAAAIVLSMLSQGKDMQAIKEATKLTIEEIELLKQSITH